MTLITAWTVSCRSEGCHILEAELITKSFLQLFSLELSSVLESSTETSSVYSESRFFILFVSAFFLKMGMRKRSILSREAIG